MSAIHIGLWADGAFCYQYRTDSNSDRYIKYAKHITTIVLPSVICTNHDSQFQLSKVYLMAMLRTSFHNTEKDITRYVCPKEIYDVRF